MNVAIYARVSTEEQARHGLSIDAQVASLRQWAADNSHRIVGEYVELGVSGRKPPSRRPELQRLLSDLPSGRIELIAFTKLDRWTRNVAGYYQVQAELDRHGVAWAAILESFETLTSGGRFRVNIMISLAEAESDRTGERIRAVFERKRERGEYTARRAPLGYRIEDHRLVPDPDTAPIVQAAFLRYADEGNVYGLSQWLQSLGYTYRPSVVRDILRNRRYIGEYRGNPNFCQPLIDPALFERVQFALSQNIKPAPTGTVYLFSGMIFCSCCGARMSAKNTNGYIYYQCPNAAFRRALGVCDHTHKVRETKLEEFLLASLPAELDAIEYAQRAKERHRKRQDPAAVKAKLSRLNEIYLDGIIEKPEYLDRREQLLALLEDTADHAPTLSAARQLLQSGALSSYPGLDRPARKALWRSAIHHITADADNNFTLYFL